jgi:hypothetical protein
LDEPVPYEAVALAEVYESFRRDVLPYPTGDIHPRFWGWVMGTGTPAGMLAEMLAAGMNAHLAGFDQSASLIECEVIEVRPTNLRIRVRRGSMRTLGPATRFGCAH